MPYPTTFLRATQNWILAGGEHASTTYALRASSAIVSLDDTTAAAIAAKATTFWNAIKVEYHPSTLFDYTKVSWIGTDGKSISSIDVSQGQSPGTGSGFPLPSEASVCCSLRTGSASRRARGRMFMPNPVAGTLTAAGRLDPSVAQLYADNLATMLGTLTVGALTYATVVASGTGNQFTGVTQVRVGDVFDVQRRRRDNLVEGYKTHTVS